MRILIIHNPGNSSGPSGEELVALEEAEALKKQGYDIIYVASEVFSVEGVSGKIKVFGRIIQIPWSISSYFWVRRLIKLYQPDIVHFHGMLPILSVSAFYACIMAKKPCVQTLHNYRWFCVEGGLVREGKECLECIRNRFLGVKYRCSKKSYVASSLLTFGNILFKRLMFRHADKIKLIAVSNAVRQKYLLAGIPEESICVKYNGVDGVDQAYEAERKRSNIVLYVGRISRNKGIETFIEAAGGCPDMHFVAIGGGSELEHYREKVKQQSITNFSFRGVCDRENVFRYIRESHCLIVPSIVSETFGRSAVEAMSCGVPVIVSDIGGLPEVVDFGQAGIIVKPGNVEELILAVKKLWCEPDVARNLGENGFKFVKHRFTMACSSRELDRIYKVFIAK